MQNSASSTYKIPPNPPFSKGGKSPSMTQKMIYADCCPLTQAQPMLPFLGRIHILNNALIFIDHILALDFHGWGNIAAGN